MMMMTRAELERRLFILRGIVIEQRSAYTDSLWWWLHRRHIKRYDAIVDNIDALSQAARSWPGQRTEEHYCIPSKGNNAPLLETR
jgi:hypothetical protein